MNTTATLKEPPTNTAAPERPAHVAMPALIVSLDQRISKILNDPGVDHLVSSVFSAIITEIDATVPDLDWRGKAARQKALDPTTPDPIAERSRAEDLEFQSRRLTAGRARLFEYHRTASARERLISWHAKADAVEVVRDKVSAILVDRFTTLTTELVAILAQVAASEAEVNRVNGDHPGMEARRLVGPEAHARQLMGLAPPSNATKLAEQTKLVSLDGKPVWPPVAP